MSFINRRWFLVGAGLASTGLAGLRPEIVFGDSNAEIDKGKARKHLMRFCHLTDMHLFGERNAAKGIGQMLEHIHKLDPKPSLLVTGGDNIMDAYETPEGQVREQFALIRKTFADCTDLPVRNCIGNHDLWGWHKANSKTTGNEPMWGTKWAEKEYGMENDYYSFDMAGWRFVICNTIQHHPVEKDWYVGGLGNDQFAWLEKLLTDTPETMPVVLVGHIPFVTVTNFEELKPEEVYFQISHRGVCADGPKILKLFTKHPNVKLCLSGHMHRLDRIDYMGVQYICDGAVSGAWWKGAFRGTGQGYGIVDLYSDGSFEHRYAAYGWKA